MINQEIQMKNSHLYFFIKMGQVITVFLCKLLDGKKWFGRIYHKMTTLYKIFTFC